MFANDGMGLDSIAAGPFYLRSSVETTVTKLSFIDLPIGQCYQVACNGPLLPVQTLLIATTLIKYSRYSQSLCRLERAEFYCISIWQFILASFFFLSVVCSAAGCTTVIIMKIRGKRIHVECDRTFAAPTSSSCFFFFVGQRLAIIGKAQVC